MKGDHSPQRKISNPLAWLGDEHRIQSELDQITGELLWE